MTLECEWCQISFQTKAQFNNHIKNSSKKCRSVAKKKITVTKKVKKKNNLKPYNESYTCENCDKTLPIKSNMKRHCSYFCEKNKTFNFKSNFTCRKCLYSTDTKSTMKKHIQLDEEKILCTEPRLQEPNLSSENPINEDLITEDKDNTREEYNAKDANTSLEENQFIVILEKVQDDEDQYKAGADEYVNEAVLEKNKFAFRNNEYRIKEDENTVENEIIADKNENESKENYVRNEPVIDRDFEDQFNNNLKNTTSKDFIGKDSSHENADRTMDLGNVTLDEINNISPIDKRVYGYTYEEMKNRRNVVIRNHKGEIIELKKKPINPRLKLFIEDLVTQVKSPKEVKHKNIKTKSKQIPKKKQETITKKQETIKKKNTSNSKIVSVKNNKKPVKQVQHKKEKKDEKVSPPKLFKKRVKEVFIVSKKFLQKEDKKCTPDIEVIEGNASGSNSPVRTRRAAAATGGARRRQLMSLSPDAISNILSSNCRSSKLRSVHPEDQPLIPQLRRLLTCDAYHYDDQQVADEFPGLYSLPWFKPLILSFLILEQQPLLLLSKILKTYMNKLLGALEVSNLTSLAMCKDRLYSSRGKTWTMKQWVQQVVNRIPELQDCIELDMAYVCIILVFHCFIVIEDRQVNKSSSTTFGVLD